MDDKQIFFGNWYEVDDVYDCFFEPNYQPPDYAPREYPIIPKDDFVKYNFIFALYNEVDGYDGDAKVVFMDGGKLYMVSGSHCSCAGLEGQWEPEEISAAYLKMRPNPYAKYANKFNYTGDFYEDARKKWDNMVRELTDNSDD
jgi:hypothetical protein